LPPQHWPFSWAWRPEAPLHVTWLHYLAPQDQAARQYQRYYRGGRYPVPCGNGADVDVRDGQCYPNGTVPPQYQQGRQQYYGGGYERRRRYYYED